MMLKGVNFLNIEVIIVVVILEFEREVEILFLCKERI